MSMLYFFWIKAIIPAALIALIELCLIEMIIHTQYVVTTEGKLKLSFGRFYPSSIISVGDILSIQSAYHFTASSADKIRIAYRGKQTNETVCISPVKKKEMKEKLERAGLPTVFKNVTDAAVLQKVLDMFK
mgnify:CR=1 FL=1